MAAGTGRPGKEKVRNKMAWSKKAQEQKGQELKGAGTNRPGTKRRRNKKAWNKINGKKRAGTKRP
jgi:hypothetical protein